MLHQVFRKIASPFKFSLMGVMLLWALTLPGQEVEVYKFLLSFTTGKPAPASSYLERGTGKLSAAEVQQEALHAFKEARPAKAPLLKLSPALLARSEEGLTPLLVASFQLSSPTFPGEAFVQAKYLLTSLQPNAP
ncbi:hypothetical protein [Rufibacter hautae]|uniref:Uncharacterized protein n=1 Tax=Rufibacter hautae TaxID=2595005 RepID=A0A5B6T8K7_9BACT|nr:hypothetical protein [Rufibacter hautae]KAA3436498.1 hypothetical protein FOA19_19090 [Rufibacter hautae]